MTIESVKARIAYLLEILPVWESRANNAVDNIQMRTFNKYGRNMNNNRAFDHSLKKGVDATKQYEDGKKELADLQNRVRLFEAGEIHLNGQPRKNSPSRTRIQAFEDKRAEYMYRHLKAGDIVYVYGGAEVVKKVNRKSIIISHARFGDTKYMYNEVFPQDDGKEMDARKLVDTVLAYFKEKENVAE